MDDYNHSRVQPKRIFITNTAPARQVVMVLAMMIGHEPSKMP
jgi:hypothetical protein